MLIYFEKFNCENNSADFRLRIIKSLCKSATDLTLSFVFVGSLSGDAAGQHIAETYANLFS